LTNYGKRDWNRIWFGEGRRKFDEIGDEGEKKKFGGRVDGFGGRIYEFARVNSSQG
jgi:hypothetical protein